MFATSGSNSGVSTRFHTQNMHVTRQSARSVRLKAPKIRCVEAVNNGCLPAIWRKLWRFLQISRPPKDIRYLLLRYLRWTCRAKSDDVQLTDVPKPTATIIRWCLSDKFESSEGSSLQPQIPAVRGHGSQSPTHGVAPSEVSMCSQLQRLWRLLSRLHVALRGLKLRLPDYMHMAMSKNVRWIT